MAKGGSLLGKADTTLTGMSYKQAMADVTPDLGQVYKDEVLTQALFEKGVQDHFNTLYADNNALADELKEATKKAMTGLGTDYEAMELFNSHLTSMKDRMKALPKGKKGDFERAKIRAELAQLQKSSADLDNTVTKLGTMISAGDFNEHATGSNNMSLYKSIADGTAKKEIVDGNLIYSIPNPLGGEDIKMDRQALEDALVQKDPEFQSNFNKIYAGENARGKQKGTTFDRQGAINDYEASFPSPAAFAANIHEKQGSLKYSFADALKYNKDGSDSIYKALMELDPATVKQYDTNKDGKITNVDFASAENGIALIDSLTNIHSDNFNYQAAKKAAAEFYADNISEKEFNDGVAMRPRDPNAETTGTDKPLFNPNMYYPLGVLGGSVTGGQINGWIDSIKNGREFDFEGNTYSHIDGAWYLNYTDGNKEGEEKSTPDSDNYIGSAENLIFSAVGDGGNDARFNNITTEKVKIIDHKTGKVQDSEDSLEKSEISVAEDFMKDETTFMEDIQKKYDLSDYIVQERQFEILPGEVLRNEIRIISRSDPKKYKDFRTKYSKASNAQKAANKWDKWIIDNKIKLKSKGKYD